ncbi:RNA polymerase-associated protein RTF1 [Acrasis kona]|uniref:RNA polymerase-associated protein RTF1 n=1 Tax=Acrasis kona TaxID=1008807 RepID=A0AAW2ZQ37_9EUKA
MSKRNTSDLTFDEEDDSDLDGYILSSVKSKKRKIDDDPKDDYEEDEYDENCIGDEADRAKLDSLPELEREMIIDARFEKRNRNRALGKSQSRDYDDGKKRGKGSGQQTATTSLSDIRAKRQAQAQKIKPVANSLSGSDMLDVDADRNRRKITKTSSESTAKQAAVNITAQQLQKIVVRRSQLEKWFNEPYFEKIVAHCFVRVLVGTDQTGRKVYKLAQVAGLAKSKNPYKFGNESDVYTVLILELGPSTKNFKMELISNSDEVGQTEFAQWCKEAQKGGHIPSEEEINEKHTEILGIKNYVYTHEDINKMVGSKIKDNRTLASISREIALLQSNLQSARDLENAEEVSNINDELEQLRREEKELRTKIATSSKIDVNAINRKNRSQNVEITMRREREGPQAKKTGDEIDPFARRTQSSAFFKLFESPTAKAKQEAEAKQNNPFEKSPGGMMSPTKSPGSSLVEAHDFDIDIDLDQKPIQLNQEVQHGIAETQQTKRLDNRKSLSLGEYKRRRGII